MSLTQEPKQTEDELLNHLKYLSNYRTPYNVMVNSQIGRTDLRTISWALLKIMDALDITNVEGMLKRGGD